MIVHFEVFAEQAGATAAILDYQNQGLNVRVIRDTALVQFAKEGTPQNPSWAVPAGSKWIAVIATDAAFTVPPALPT